MNRFQNVIMESDDEEAITIGDLDLNDDGEKEPETESNADGRMLEEGELGRMGYHASDDDVQRARGPIGRPDDDDNEMNVNDVDLGTFGTDTSDVQNDYDPKEIELLMKLMASEADALGEYLDAAKVTNIDVLRRLFADIGAEERFHMEQLLFAKAQLTGEKYEPKDPDVKKEYEDLLAMGMDEETAMQTAVDKLHIRGSMSINADDDAVEISGETETLEFCTRNFAAMFDSFMEAVDAETFDQKKYDHATDVFIECCMTSEAAYVGNATEAQDDGNGGIKTKKTPLTVIRDALGALLSLVGKLINKIVQLLRNTKNRAIEIKRFIKRYGLQGIFKDGLKMYFYDVDHPGAVADALVYWILLVYDVIVAAGKSVGINVSIPGLDTQERSPKLMINGDIQKGIQLLNQVQLIRTKSLIPQDKEKQEFIAQCLLGYTDQKGVNGKSINVLHTLQTSSDQWTMILKGAQNLANELDNMPQEQNSAYFTKRERYNTAVEAMKVVAKTCKAVINAITSDINTIAKLNTALMDKTAAQDKADVEANPDLKERVQKYNRFQQALK